ncbi:MAG: DUF3572 domain-containing protein [Paracoccus sp. (in: a-proteobacteria)]|uniref:DUF3572 domain-containing protein n=1 Tax=Paracoccus sp. TaxID=267 RepID=UPI00391887D0
MTLHPDRARDLATDLLLHLTGHPDLMQDFLTTTGLSAGDLRMMAQDGSAGAALLDFLAEDDARLIACAQALSVTPQDLMAARTVLAGPGSYGWSVD